MHTLVLGIGNTLLSDEGCGVHVVHHLRETRMDLAGITWMDGGTLSFTLAPAIETAQNLIVVDAAQLHAEPGTVQCFIGADMDRFVGGKKHSVHEVSLSDLLDMARLSDALPAKRALVGIQPASMDWGDSPTPAVAAAIPHAAQVVLAVWKDFLPG